MMVPACTLRAVFAALIVLASIYGVCGKCRMDPEASHDRCGLPDELSNFQGHHECDDRVKILKPQSISELQEVVREYPRVKAVGVGHSWWKEQFCSGDDEDAVNVVMTEYPPVRSLYSGQSLTSLERSPAFPIQVDEKRRTVTVAAGVSQRILLDYLADYRTEISPDGWILPTFSWFIDQTIGGAIATGSHGSSITYGSLSNILVALRAVLADGSYIEITRESDPHLFKAFMVQVGRLGIITDLTLQIIPQKLHERRSQEMKFDAFLERMQRIQSAYRTAKATGDSELIYESLRPLDETQAFWFAPTSDIWLVDYQTIGNKETTPINFSPLVNAYAVSEQRERSRVNPNFMLRSGTPFFSNYVKSNIRPRVADGLYDTRKAYLTMSEDMNVFHAGFSGYDQYEVSFPLESFADCLATVGEEMYSDADLWEGFVTPMLIRFVKEEDAYLSNTHGGPRAYVNLEDYLSYNTGNTNRRFQRVMEIFRTKCDARLHWGKAGWPRHAPCFDGATEYPETWCDFGCAAQMLDPTRKFEGMSNVWEWRATDKAGNPVEFASCCTPKGFDKRACTCASRETC